MYRATGVANVNVVACPAGFLFESYGGTATVVRKRATVTVTGVRSACSRANLLPMATDDTLVVDRRLAQAVPPVKDVAYRVEAGSKWPPAAEAQKLNGRSWAEKAN